MFFIFIFFIVWIDAEIIQIYFNECENGMMWKWSDELSKKNLNFFDFFLVQIKIPPTQMAVSCMVKILNCFLYRFGSH